MGAISITAGNVLADASASLSSVTFGDTITQGMSVYYHAGSGTYKKAQANALATLVNPKIALTSGASGQPGVVANSGPITMGATLLAGEEYCVSAALAGAIVPVTDLTTGGYASSLGYATTIGILTMDVHAAGVVKA